MNPSHSVHYAALLVAFVLGCVRQEIQVHDADSTPPPQTESDAFSGPPPSFETVQKILERDCAPCHRNSGPGPTFFKQTGVELADANAISEIARERLQSQDVNKVMPPRNSAYKADEAGGKALLRWFSQENKL